MPGRSKIPADEQERSALRALARSARRGEADRARAILLTLAGRRAAEIAAGLGGQVSTVREWRGRSLRGGAAALRHRKPPGRPNRVGAAAVALAAIRLAEAARHERGWTLARRRAAIRRRDGPAIGRGRLSGPRRRTASLGAAPATR
jgi:transposase